MINKERRTNSILRSTVIVALLAMTAKIVGFLRQLVIAAFFGATAATDAFFFAEALPGMIFPCVCDSISIAFLSCLIEKRHAENDTFANGFASQMLLGGISISVILGLIGATVAPIIIPVLAPGFSASTTAYAIQMSQMVMYAFVLTMITYLLGAILNASKVFAYVQIAAMLSNLFLICMTLLGGREQPIIMLAITVIAGHVIQCMMLFIACCKKGLLSFRPGGFSRDVRNVIVAALPIMLSNGVLSVQAIADKYFASMLESGAVSALSYAASLNSIVSSILIVSMSTVLFPSLAENRTKQEYGLFSVNLERSMQMNLLVLLPVSAIACVWAKEIVTTVYARGSFDTLAVENTASILTFYSLTYLFSGINTIMTRAYYACKETKKPALYSLIAIPTGVLFEYYLTAHLGLIGIPIGALVALVLLSLFLLVGFKKAVPYASFHIDSLSVFVKLGAAFIATVLAVIAKVLISFQLPIIALLFGSFILLTIYYFALYVFGCKEIMVLSRIARTFFARFILKLSK